MLYFIFFSIFFVSSIFAAPVVLVTGGAGYIGSHVCYALKKAGFDPVVYDSLINGSADAIKWGSFVQGDLQDREKLDQLFLMYKPVAVVHLAALHNVGESVKVPYEFYNTNVVGTLNVLKCMLKHEVNHIIFSSTSAVYGFSDQLTLDEDLPKKPVSPYARSKWFVEQILEDFECAYGLKYVALRYFNVAGVGSELGLKRRLVGSVNPVIPTILLSLQTMAPFVIYGTDYPTFDGTAIRDYIHVMDIAQAHVEALLYLQNMQQSLTLNLGSGSGHSVFELIRAVEDVTNLKVSIILEPRRAGDIAQAVSNPARSRSILHYTPNYSDLHSMIESEWKALK